VKIVFIRNTIVTNKRGYYSFLLIIVVPYMEHWKIQSAKKPSLGSITRPGSLGIISASQNQHPFEMAQMYYSKTKHHNKK